MSMNGSKDLIYRHDRWMDLVSHLYILLPNDVVPLLFMLLLLFLVLLAHTNPFLFDDIHLLLAVILKTNRDVLKIYQ